MTKTFDRLRQFISIDMRMSHVYQPVMLQTLLREGGRATVRQIAESLLHEDDAQLSYYEEITKRMPGSVLRKRGIVEWEAGTYTLPGTDELTVAEREELSSICSSRIEGFLKSRIDPWSHRRVGVGRIPGIAKFEVLKRAHHRCELCGVSADVRALEVDHILPRNRGGLDDLSNLQALCYSCNATKRDRDDTDFRGMEEDYGTRQFGCAFCEVEPHRLMAGNELFLAIRDAFPVTTGHALLVPKRHVESPSDLFQPELNAMWSLAAQIRTTLAAGDPAIDGFNVGFNDGVSAGQTVMHAHLHVIPRRTGDMTEPRGGVRGVIPSRQAC